MTSVRPGQKADIRSQVVEVVTSVHVYSTGGWQRVVCTAHIVYTPWSPPGPLIPLPGQEVMPGYFQYSFGLFSSIPTLITYQKIVNLLNLYEQCVYSCTVWSPLPPPLAAPPPQLRSRLGLADRGGP